MARRTAYSPNPKRECHKCPLNGKGDDYCWRKCLGPAEESGKGLKRVTLGGMEAADEYLHNNAAEGTAFRRAEDDLRTGGGECDRESGVTISLPYEVERGLVKVLASFMSLTDVQLCIFRHVYNGESLAQAARRLIVPMSKQAVSKHVRAIRDSNPVVGKVIAQLVRLPDSPRRNQDTASGDDADGDSLVQTNLFDTLFAAQG